MCTSTELRGSATIAFTTERRAIGPEASSDRSTGPTLFTRSHVLASMREEPGPDTATRDELRTIAFRLREIQRMLGVRVEQENRRLEADGIEPVTEAEFFRAKPPDETDQ